MNRFDALIDRVEGAVARWVGRRAPPVQTVLLILFLALLFVVQAIRA